MSTMQRSVSKFVMLGLFLSSLCLSVLGDTATCTGPTNSYEFWPLRSDSTGAYGNQGINDEAINFQRSAAYYPSNYPTSSDAELYASSADGLLISPFAFIATARFDGAIPATSGHLYYPLVTFSDFPSGNTGWGLYCDGTSGLLHLFNSNTVSGSYTDLPSSFNCATTGRNWMTYVVTYSTGSFKVYVNALNAPNASPIFDRVAVVDYSTTPNYFMIGNVVAYDQPWEGAIVDAAWFGGDNSLTGDLLTPDQISNLQPFKYANWLCQCPAGMWADFTDGAECVDAAEKIDFPTSQDHGWIFDQASTSDVVADSNFDGGVSSEGTYTGFPFVSNAFNFIGDSGDATAFGAGTYVSGTFDTSEKPWDAATWTVTGWVRRDTVLSAQGVLCQGAGNNCVGFHPSDTTKIGFFQQNHPELGVYVTVAGGFVGAVTYVAVSYVAGNVTVTAAVTPVSGPTLTWYTNWGVVFQTSPAVDGWVVGGHVTGSAQSGGMTLQEVRFYKYTLSQWEIVYLGNQTITNVPAPAFSSAPTGVTASSSAASGVTPSSSAPFVTASSSASTVARSSSASTTVARSSSASTGTARSSSASTAGGGGGGGASSSADNGGGGGSGNDASSNQASLAVALVAMMAVLAL